MNRQSRKCSLNIHNEQLESTGREILTEMQESKNSSGVRPWVGAALSADVCPSKPHLSVSLMCP